MLVKGDVKVHIQCESWSVVLVFQDCLHAPSAPINLILVGAMHECWMCVHFNEDTTIICFLSDHPVLTGLSFKVTILCHLSFLKCDFLRPDQPITDGMEVAFLTFPIVESTPALWHCCLGHLGLDATCATLTKNYVTGVD